MDISINGEKAEITLEAEKTIGDILTGLDNWLAGTYTNTRGNALYRISGLVIDGIAVNEQSLEDSFTRQLASIKTLDIHISSLRELLHTALQETIHAIAAWEKTDFPDKSNFLKNWKTSPAAAFLSGQSHELYTTVAQTFSGENPGAAVLAGIINERLRELENPSAELDSMERVIGDTVSQLENLPLNFQTGKDKQAAETIQLFSGVTEKIFRIFNLLNTGGNFTDTIKLMPEAEPYGNNTAPGGNTYAACGKTRFPDFLDEFNATLKEMLSAYERKDTVLVGDLAEYEMAPRLRSFYTALKSP
ncbi:MAG: hypothetical protein LBG91_03830 [Treponema sp.]|jgi:hypothetical protein|nr:hypothetical protein [Treponema sp.]